MHQARAVPSRTSRLLNAEVVAVNAEQRQPPAAVRGNRSKRAIKAETAFARRHRKVAYLPEHRQACCKRRRIVTEDLSIDNMIAYAKGMAEKPGKNITQKAGLNRAILGRGARAFLKCLVHQDGRSWVSG
jgi:putative transposase